MEIKSLSNYYAIFAQSELIWESVRPQIVCEMSLFNGFQRNLTLEFYSKRC
jgi:hypothetical protein